MAVALGPRPTDAETVSDVPGSTVAGDVDEPLMV